LRALGEKHRLQFVRIVGKPLDRLRHSRRTQYFLPSFDLFDALIHCVAAYPGNAGAGVSFATRTRRQSSRSSSAESCAADNRITPVINPGPAELAVPVAWRRGIRRPVLEHEFNPIRALGLENVSRAVEGIGLHRLAHQRRETLAPFRESTGSSPP